MYRWKPKVACTYKGKYWDPQRDEVMIAEDAPHHFERLGEASQIEKKKNVTGSKQEQAEIDANAEHGIDKLSPEERADLIRKKAKDVNADDKKAWYHGVPTVREMTGRLPFTVTHKEIKEALGIT